MYELKEIYGIKIELLNHSPFNTFKARLYPTDKTETKLNEYIQAKLTSQ